MMPRQPQPEIKLQSHLKTTQYALPSTQTSSQSKKTFSSLPFSVSSLAQQLQKRCARMFVGGGCIFDVAFCAQGFFTLSFLHMWNVIKI